MKASASATHLVAAAMLLVVAGRESAALLEPPPLAASGRAQARGRSACSAWAATSRMISLPQPKRMFVLEQKFPPKSRCLSRTHQSGRGKAVGGGAATAAAAFTLQCSSIADRLAGC